MHSSRRRMGSGGDGGGSLLDARSTTNSAARRPNTAGVCLSAAGEPCRSLLIESPLCWADSMIRCPVVGSLKCTGVLNAAARSKTNLGYERRDFRVWDCFAPFRPYMYIISKVKSPPNSTTTRPPHPRPGCLTGAAQSPLYHHPHFPSVHSHPPTPPRRHPRRRPKRQQQRRQPHHCWCSLLLLLGPPSMARGSAAPVAYVCL